MHESTLSIANAICEYTNCESYDVHEMSEKKQQQQKTHSEMMQKSQMLDIGCDTMRCDAMYGCVFACYMLSFPFLLFGFVSLLSF